MNVKILLCFLAAITTLPVYSAPVSLASPAVKDGLNSTLNQLKTGLSTLKNTVQNHESEIRTFEHKLETQEANFEALDEKISSSCENQQIAIQNYNVHFESRMNSLESTLNSLISDMKLLKQQGNESASAFAQYKQKLLEMEKAIDIQNQQISQLEAALKSMMGILQVKENISVTHSNSPESMQAGGTYKVQPGDTLEKIARKNNMTLKALKEINQLSNDRIIVGQTLMLPQQ